MKNLGVKYPLPDDDDEVESAPCMPAGFDKKSPDYGKPDLRLELPEGTELPESGVIKLRYRIRTKTEDMREGECRYELIVDELVSVDPAADEVDSSDEALDKFTCNR